MPLIVEDGSVVSGANTWVSSADAESYLADRGVGMGTGTSEPFLLQAMDNLMNLDYAGSKTAPTNPLPFPRSGVSDKEGNTYASNVIPNELVVAQIWLSHYISTGANPGAVTSGVTGQTIKKEKVDVLEVEYYDSKTGVTQLSIAELPNVYGALAHLLDASVLAENAGTGGGTIYFNRA